MDKTPPIHDCTSEDDRQRWLATRFEANRARLKRMVDLSIDRRLKGRVDASDVVQEVYLEAERRLDEYLDRPPVPVFLWMRSLTEQRLEELHRQHLGVQAGDIRRESLLSHEAVPQATSEALAARLLGQTTSPDGVAVGAERRIRLQELFNSMDPSDREIIALRSFEHLSNSEAAQVLGISAGSARRRFVGALGRLKVRLEQTPEFREETR